jgi:hypothetical protein
LVLVFLIEILLCGLVSPLADGSCVPERRAFLPATSYFSVPGNTWLGILLFNPLVSCAGFFFQRVLLIFFRCVVFKNRSKREERKNVFVIIKGS